VAYITVSIAEFERSVDTVAIAWADTDCPIYNETTTFHGSKSFFANEDRVKLLAHKLQSYAMELLDEED
jgi:hypothetical protein